MGSASDPAAFASLAAFLRATRTGVAQEASATPLGTRLRHRELTRIPNVNGLLVDPELGPDAAPAILAECERLEREEADVRISLPDGPLAQALTSLVERGWSAERHLVMLLRAPIVPAAGAPVAVEVEPSLAREIERAVERSSSYGGDAVLIEQILAYNDAVGRVTDARSFAAEGASVCTLLTDGRIAQVESVVTLPQARGRGLARATIAAAVAAAAAAGSAATFIVADASDWPHELYGRLGFETAGVVAHFSRELAGVAA